MRRLALFILFPSALFAQTQSFTVAKIDTIKSKTDAQAVRVADSLTVSGKVTVSGGFSGVAGDFSSTFTAGANAALTHKLTSSSSPSLYVYRTTNSATSSIGLSFRANNAASSEVEYARVGGQIIANTTGLQSGSLLFYTTKSGTTTNYESIDSIGNRPLIKARAAATTGFTAIRDTVTWTAQTGTITPQGFVSTTTGVKYRATYYLHTTTASGSGSPTVTITVGYNNGAAKTQTSPTSLDLATVNAELTGQFIFYVASGTPTWSTTYAAGAGTPQYAVRVTLEELD